MTAALSKQAAEFNESTLKVQQSEKKEDECLMKEEPLKKAVIDPKQMTN